MLSPRLRGCERSRRGRRGALTGGRKDEPRRGKLEHEELLHDLDERSQGWARRVMSAVEAEGGEG